MNNPEYWYNEKVDDWECFVKLISCVTKKLPAQKHRFLYRGQSNVEWKLESSFRRKLNKVDNTRLEEIYRIENDLKIEFESRVHLYQDQVYKPAKDNWLEWWAIMQHYKAPTRLLDWTSSPYVAAYFAVESNDDRDGVVWVINDWALGDRMRALYSKDWEKWEDSETPTRYWDKVSRSFNEDTKLFRHNPGRRIFFFQPEQKSHRVSAQQGWLSCSSDHYICYEKVVGDLFENHRIKNATSPEYYKNWKYWNSRIIIPHSQKKEFLRQLHLINITAATIFPGIDGLGQYISEAADIALVNDRYGSSHPLG